ncbi:uncharacterized protein LOC132730739 [Ruditapes philippinarum]|uniref:uncharacterized protein LOC132730739 n=1 Tax=Ruditapes philippinarum TaxID=129788 RepID=UPI00295BD787|nr:uncharacterized protein LOC132730739 [Ruditapes philippinarum]
MLSPFLKYTIFCALFIGSIKSWDPDAGLIKSYTKLHNVTVQASSGSHPENVIDSNDNTNWVSAHCLPSGYLNRNDVNIIFGACKTGACLSSGNSGNGLGDATDGNPYTAAHVQKNGSSAFLSVDLVNSQVLQIISVGGVFPSPTHLYVYETTKFGFQKHLLKTYTSTDNYKNINIPGTNFTVNKLELVSDSGFTVKDIGAIGENGCTEHITVDLGHERRVGTIRTRHWAGSNAAIKLVLKTSTNGHIWNMVADLDPNAVHAVTSRFRPADIRYITLEYKVHMVNYKKVYCFEVDAWDENGIWGPEIAAKPQVNTFREMLGVNGIWGWGTKSYSDKLGPNEGPLLYSEVASHARNYHNLVWDVTDPDLDPEYDAMAAGHGTQAMWWLNWDTEYRAWNAANLTVDISIQFTNKTVPESKWNTPEQSAFHYGQQVAKHFGSVHGNGLVQAVEVGNEPWDYNAAFYASVLKGMASGLKSMDNKLIVIPGTFQAEDKDHENTYIGTRVLPEVADNIDVINCHTYSFINDDAGIRKGTYPENKLSTFNNIRPITRWRDTNTPNKPIWVTEWGWDSYGVGEQCRGTECVSERAQAVYAVRGLLLLARSNIEKATWYFYANTDCDTLFCRSGLTSSHNNNFQKKAVFYTFQKFLQYVGNTYFLGVIQENDNGFVYALSDRPHACLENASVSDLLQHASHVIGWLPVDISNKNSRQTTLQLPAETQVSFAWRITGSSNDRLSKTSEYQQSGNSLEMTLKTEPLVLKFNHKTITSIVG